MTRTTPPRPVDPAAVFPELAALTRTATRLHPRAGEPTADDSSVGGPLLWPEDEPWPVCGGEHEVWEVTTPDDVRLLRRILTAAWQRPRPRGARLLTPEEEEVVDRIHAGRPKSEMADGPVLMLPVVQLYARDIPDADSEFLKIFPEGTDLLQVLWCPFDHPEDYAPAVRARWRRAADVVRPLAQAPEPPLIGMEEYVPQPCVLHPEQVTEYPAADRLPDDLVARIRAWEQESGGDVHYSVLAVAHGWKAGGWAAPWTFRDPVPLSCGECGGGVDALLTIDGAEWDGDKAWRPVEDADDRDRPPYPSANGPTMVTIGRGYTLQVYRCTRDARHPVVTAMQ